MPYLISNIPHFKVWVRREYTCNHEQYHGEFLHGMAIAVNTIPDRCLSFQIILNLHLNYYHLLNSLTSPKIYHKLF